MDDFILIINGSPHKDGYTARMMNCLTNLLGKHCRIKICDAFAEHFAPCNDCGACKKLEGCSQNDMDTLYCDFERCRAVVICTPIYNMSFPAPLKTIIDRFQRYFNARFSLGIKPPVANYRPAVLIATGGDAREDGELMKKQLERIFTVTNCKLIDSLIFTGTDSVSKNDFPNNELKAKIYDCVQKLLLCVKKV